jgi:hypothetical protein
LELKINITRETSHPKYFTYNILSPDESAASQGKKNEIQKNFLLQNRLSTTRDAETGLFWPYLASKTSRI